MWLVVTYCITHHYSHHNFWWWISAHLLRFGDNCQQRILSLGPQVPSISIYLVGSWYFLSYLWLNFILYHMYIFFMTLWHVWHNILGFCTFKLPLSYFFWKLHHCILCFQWFDDQSHSFFYYIVHFFWTSVKPSDEPPWWGAKTLMAYQLLRFKAHFLVYFDRPFISLRYTRPRGPIKLVFTLDTPSKIYVQKTLVSPLATSKDNNFSFPYHLSAPQYAIDRESLSLSTNTPGVTQLSILLKIQSTKSIKQFVFFDPHDHVHILTCLALGTHQNSFKSSFSVHPKWLNYILTQLKRFLRL